MDRLACVDLPAFPLQLLLRRHPDWSELPAAVVDHDKPQGVLLWINERARALGVLPGMRYAAALSLADHLRAGEVAAHEIEAGVASAASCLRAFTPEVEPAEGEPGVFWLDASGLARIFRSPAAWGRAIRAALAAQGIAATVVVGYSRFGTYAVARERPGVLRVFADAEAERAAAYRVPLARLHLDPRDRNDLIKLGVRDVSGLVKLPPGGVMRAFGPELLRLHEMARGWERPLSPEAPVEAVRGCVHLDFPENDTTRLLFEVKRLLHPLLAVLARRGQGLAQLELRLALDRAGEHVERLRTAAPTLDEVQVMDLVRLRLEAAKLPAGVNSVVIEALGEAATAEQLAMFEARPRRDLAAADRAVSRLRAKFGEEAAVRAELRDAHLPQASFAWVPMGRLRPASGERPRRLPLIRRVRAARPLHDHAVEERDGWRIGPIPSGRVIRSDGPYVVSGGWWATEVHREYHIAETERGDLLWIFYDRRRRRWYEQGRIE